MSAVFVLLTTLHEDKIRVVGVYRSKEEALQAFEEKVCQSTSFCNLRATPSDLRAELARDNSVRLGYNSYCYIEQSQLF